MPTYTYQNIDIATLAAELVAAIQSNLLITTTEQFLNALGNTVQLQNIASNILYVGLNGQGLTQGVDYTFSGNTITFDNPLTADTVIVIYQY